MSPISFWKSSDFERDLGKEGRADVMIAANAVNGTKGGLGSSYLSSIIQDFNREKGFASMGSGREWLRLTCSIPT